MPGTRGYLLVDANVLIDYVAADLNVADENVIESVTLAFDFSTLVQ